MRKSNHLFTLLLVFLSLTALTLGISSCANKKVPEDVAYYTCPMHPQIKMDRPGQCPICSMDLIPVRKTSLEGHEERGTPSPEAATLAIDPVRLQNIGMRTEEIEYRSLSKSFSVQGKVAYDPELYVTQQEYLIALRLGDASLIRSAERKLQWLGLSEEWIGLIRAQRKISPGLYLPAPGEPTFFEAFLPQSDLRLVRPGQKVKVYDLDSRFLSEGILRALGTVLEMESRTLRALIQADRSLNLKPNAFVQLRFELDLGKRLALPKEAILFNGDHNMVYVETAPGRFMGKKVELGEAAGDFYEIKQGLEAGEKAVINGHFLIDSETRMRMGTTGGHQH